MRAATAAERKAAKSAYNRAYREAHHEEALAYGAAYAASHRDEARLRARTWYAEHREQARRARVAWEALRYEERKRQLADLRREAGCRECGAVENLVFHHVDPDTKVNNVGKMWGWGWEKVLREIDKCIVLCRGCHARYHLSQRRPVYKSSGDA